MTKADVHLAKAAILKCLTEDFTHGTGRKNIHIFDKTGGWQCYNDTDLMMVMDKVVLGLYLALHESEQEIK